jgi:hypothetical protein
MFGTRCARVKTPNQTRPQEGDSNLSCTMPRYCSNSPHLAAPCNVGSVDEGKLDSHPHFPFEAFSLIQCHRQSHSARSAAAVIISFWAKVPKLDISRFFFPPNPQAMWKVYVSSNYPKLCLTRPPTSWCTQVRLFLTTPRVLRGRSVFSLELLEHGLPFGDAGTNLALH